MVRRIGKVCLIPLDPLLRSELIRYGEMAQACYNAFDSETFSKYCGSCKYRPTKFFEYCLGLMQHGYEVTSYLYASCNINLPDLFQRSVMVGQHKYVVPVDPEAAVPAKKKTQSSRIWILLDCTGQSTVLDVDKYDIMRRCQIHSRDLRILDPLLSYPSTIIGREKAIVLNLESLHLNSELWKPRTTELETAACPAMDELISKVRDELEQLLDDEDDMADLCLSSKVGWPIFTW
ncbi:hypothetical protein Patl1_25236 [Pistacia atlantica]|uniref:Uncharacterized protein n=1 Tax=Pistacia atlantica TaxID=434234 RepID=A0ACC1B3V5_9ROSI|nr:hypothetical protein Patl1_25236 [Pistacia atlantica]